jgi:hypothetical protein
MEVTDDFDVLDVWDSVPNIAEMFHIIPNTLFMLMHDGLRSFCHRWTLVHALEVADEHGT